MSKEEINVWENEINRLIKCYPALEKHKQELMEFISEGISPALLKYAPRIDGSRNHREKEREKNRKKLKKFQKAKEKHETEKYDNEIEQIESKMLDNKQGNQSKLISSLVAPHVKSFWIDTMGHEKFYYGGAKRHPDNATEFVDLFISVVFGDDPAIIAKSSFRAISDRRRAKRKLKK